MLSDSVIARFWTKVDKNGPITTAALGPCWDWVAFRLPNSGYGRFRVPGPNGVQQAHRVSYALAFGAFDDALDVLHRCDRPCCVNPAHLFIGTAQDNTDDKVSKLRHDFGVKHARALLTDAVVLAMREAHACGESTCAIARRAEMSQSTVYDAIVGRTWQHLPLAKGRTMPASVAERKRAAAHA